MFRMFRLQEPEGRALHAEVGEDATRQRGEG